MFFVDKKHDAIHFFITLKRNFFYELHWVY